MKNLCPRTVALASVLAALMPLLSSAEATIYSAPEGIDHSSEFAVKVDGEEAFVFFMSENRYREHYLPAGDVDFRGEEKVIVRNVVHDLSQLDTSKSRESWVSFEAEKPVRIEVMPLDPVQSPEEIMLIDQQGTMIEHTRSGDRIAFTAQAGHKYLLVLNQDLSSRLTIFAEHPETDVPNIQDVDTFLIEPGTPRADYETTTRKTLYFAPGLHEIGDAFPLRPGLQVYLAPGAYVRGYFTCPPGADTAGAAGVKIYGRGILSGENNQTTEGPNYNFLPRPLGFWSNSIYLGGFNREPADDQIVKGITIIYPSEQPIVGNGRNTLIENVKVLNLEKGFGGICVGSQATVKDCYVSTDTRALTSFGSETTFRNNFIVGFRELIPFYFGDRILDDLQGITVADSTVVGDWQTLFSVHQLHFGDLRDFNFRNVRAYAFGSQPNRELLSLGVGFSPYRRPGDRGSIEGVSVSDIEIRTLGKPPAISVSAFGFSEQAAVRTVSVKGIRVNGDPATLRPAIQQHAYDVTVGDRGFEAGQLPVAKEPSRNYPMLEPVENPAQAFPRRDVDGDRFGRRIAHEVAYPSAEQKADPAFPKTLADAFGNLATGASLEGIKTIAAPAGDFLQTYSPVSDPRMSTLHSPDYAVFVSQQSSETSAAAVPVYESIGTLMSTGQRLMNPPPMLTEHFANFTHRGPVEVTVRMKERAPAVEDALILPSASGIMPTYAADGRSFSFTLSGPQYLVIIVNSDWMRPLFLFGNPPEDPVPDPADPAVLTIHPRDDFGSLANRRKLADYRVINFAPGYHDIGLFFPVFSNQTIYIPGDAFVAGTILGVNRDQAENHAYGTRLITQNKDIFEFPAFKLGYEKAEDYIYIGSSNRALSDFLGTIENFTIRGRGILSGEQMDWFKGHETIPGYIILVDRAGKNGVLEGLTFTGRHFHSANFFGAPSLLANVKTLYGFHGNTDASQWGMVRRNFFSTQMDDGTYIRNGLDIDGWFAWQQNNANTFCFARSLPNDGNTLGHAHLRNVTVIDGRYGASGMSNLAKGTYNPMRGGFWLGINHDRSSHNFGFVADVVMQNIRFETIVNPLFQFAPMTGTNYNQMIGVEDITFDNIQVPMGQNWQSIFGGRPEAPDDHMRGIVIKDLFIGDQKVTTLEEFARVRSDGRNLDVKIE